MIRICPKCSVKLSPNDVVCPICQTQSDFGNNTCANRSNVLSDDVSFCENCGSSNSRQYVNFPTASLTKTPSVKPKNISLLIFFGSFAGLCFIGLSGWLLIFKRDLLISGKNQSYQIEKADTSGAKFESFTANPQNTQSTNVVFTKNFRGYVSSVYVEVEIKRSGNILIGIINESGRQIELTGTVDENGFFKLDELDDYGAKTGIYRGKFNLENEMEGNWSLPNGTKQRSFLWSAN
jgi:hypothetical protein